MRSLKQLARKAWITHVNRSHTCDLCAREVFSYPTPRLCQSCLHKLIKNEENFCEKCGRKTKTEGVCLQCKGEPPRFQAACSPIVYFGDGALLINSFKNGKRYLAFYLAEQMQTVLPRLGEFPQPPVIVPVPLTKKKRRERGYNQAEELALCLSELTGYPCQPNLLLKVKTSAQQKHLTAQERHKEIIGSFRITDRAFCKDQIILLVDDILTTGATCSEIARILTAAGAAAIYVCTACALPERS